MDYGRTLSEYNNRGIICTLDAVLARPSKPRIEGVPQAVSHQIHPEYSDGEHQPREEHDPYSQPEEELALTHHVAPGRCIGWYAGAQEAQARLSEHGQSEHEGTLYQYRRYEVGEDVSPQDAYGPGPNGPGGFDVLTLSNR